MKHLSSHNYRLLSQNTFTDEHTLDTGNTFLRNFNAQVTASYHHTVSYFQNFIDVINAFLIFYLGNNPDIAVMGIQYFLYIQNILFITYKRVSNKINIFLNGIQDICTVLLRQRRKIDTYTRYIYTLTTSQSSIILYLTHQIIIRLFHNDHFQIAIIYKNMYADSHIVHKVRIRDRNTFARSVQIGITYYFYLIPYFIRNRFSTDGSAHLRSLSIHQDSYAIRYRTHIIYQHLRAFAAEMCRVHTHHIHTGFKQAFYKINVAAFIRNGCNDLSLF